MQGVLLIAVGVIALASALLFPLLTPHLDVIQQSKAPVLVVVGVFGIVIGVLRLRGRIED